MNHITPRESCRTPQEPYGNPWNLVEGHETAWKLMERDGKFQKSIVVAYIILWEPWNIMETHGSLWKPIEPSGIFHEILM